MKVGPIVLAFAAAAIVLMPGEARAQESMMGPTYCYRCQNTLPCWQTCEGGDWGENCTHSFYEGCQYCNTGGAPCGGLALQQMRPEQLSPAGTYVLASGDPSDVSDGIRDCGEFVVSFQDIGRNTAAVTLAHHLRVARRASDTPDVITL